MKLVTIHWPRQRANATSHPYRSQGAGHCQCTRLDRCAPVEQIYAAAVGADNAGGRQTLLYRGIDEREHRRRQSSRRVADSRRAAGGDRGQYLAPYVVPTVRNLAQGKAASQSSTGSGGGANRAVDGNTNGTYSVGSVTHTTNSRNAWWQVDLGANSAIDSIQLWNRTDCCADRLSNFYVFVSAANISGRSFSSLVNDSTVWRYQMTGQAPAKLDIPVGVSGRYVRVQLAVTNCSRRSRLRPRPAARFLNCQPARADHEIDRL